MTFTVTPAARGGWLAFISGPRLLLLSSSEDIAGTWSALDGDAGFQATLDLLTSHGLAATPSFVLVEWQGEEARIIVRGEVPVAVTDASGSQQLSAVGVSTWVERSLGGVTAIGLEVPGASAAGDQGLPLQSGVSLVAAIASEGIPLPAAPAAPAAKVAAPAAPAEQPTPPAEAPGHVDEPADVGMTVREVPETAPEPIGAPPTAGDVAEGYDYLFGDTMYRGVADAAVREPEPDTEEDGPADPSAHTSDDALHDGETVMTSDIAKLRGKRRPRKTEPVAAPEAPKLVLVLPSGAREPLTHTVLVGRSPSVSKVTGGQIPRLITMGNADQDISRNHAQFALEGGTVVVTDLHSRNGTSIVLPGKSPQKLRAGEPTSVIVGTVVDFGGGVTITVDEDR